MSLFDFESAERDERTSHPIREHGDTFRALIDHRWFSFAIIMFIVAVMAHIPALMAAVAFMLVVLFFAWLWSRHSLQGLTYNRRFPYRRFFPGEETEVTIEIKNHKLLPLSWLQAEDSWPLALSPTDSSHLARYEHDPDLGSLINVYSLRWYERIRRRYTILVQQRGVYEIGPVELLSGDPFSLFDRKISLRDRREIIVVYPHIKTLPELGLPLKDPFGDRRVQRSLFEDPNRTMGIRDYSPQDSFRHIHWKATARAGALQTRVYEPTHSLRTVLCLNVATFEQHWRGVWPAMLEYEMDTAASLANWCLAEGHSVGIAANGTLAHADQPFRIPPSRNRDQLPRILEALAAVSYFVTAGFDRFLIEESPRLPWGATLVLITPFLNEAIMASMFRLRDSGRRLVCIVLGNQEPPFLPGILTYHLPINEEEPLLPEEDEDEEDAAADLTPRQRYLLRRAREEAAGHERKSS